MSNPQKNQKKPKVIDLKKSLADKSAEEFSNEIKTGKLHRELKPKKAKSEKTT